MVYFMVGMFIIAEIKMTASEAALRKTVKSKWKVCGVDIRGNTISKDNLTFKGLKMTCAGLK